MICPKCSFEQPEKNSECARCGLIFKKYKKWQDIISKKSAVTVQEQSTTPRNGTFIRELLLSVEPETNPLYFGGRVLAFLIIFIWGWKLILTPMETNYIASSFIHLVNLPFHEAGHILFRPFGQLMTSIGGTLGQLLMPLLCLTVFIMRYRNAFGASVSLWWFGENLMDIAPYINDARELKLQLLGGTTGHDAPYGFHDWQFILNEMGLIRYDHSLAHGVYAFGTVLMIISFVWAAYLLFRQYRNIDMK